jgi:peptide deformylase
VNIILKNHPDFPVVFGKADQVDDIETQVKPYLRRMYEILNRRKGISLGAQQVGINRAFFVYGGRACGMGFFITVINPTVASMSPTKFTVEEADLSDPARKLKLERPNFMTVDYDDIMGQHQNAILDGILVQVFLHEIERQSGRSPFRQ